ncbi:MAG: glucosyl-3-phosphoglycerate synthase [Actinobacteria bacterium]|nr:glucosyl-3-phosphoglycerate synthase [Actinomycetota bacterium]
MSPAQLDASAQGWFRDRTWVHTDFTVDDLLGDKEVTVSVVIPAVNEAETVAEVVATAGRLRHRGLVDEVLVIDGGSADETVSRARDAGAQVVDQATAVSDVDPGTGKGDALWKGLAVSEGDLVVFLDADLHDAEERYVVGLLGPLLVEPEVGYVKACYERPFDLGVELRPQGGGRVTELLARPLLATFWPHLAGLAQPLAGEYAGRRSVLQQVPFVQGWGVELALLIDIAGRFGTGAIAQVDLGARVHSHQTLAALGRMAGEILHVAADRLRGEGRLGEAALGGTLFQPERGPNGRIHLTEAEIEVRERPPLHPGEPHGRG